jgi:hypothetical protein
MIEMGSTTAASTGATAIDIKTLPVAQCDVSGMDASQIMDILHGLDVTGVQDAATAHLELSEKLSQVAARLAASAHTLAQNWQGAAAQAAMSRFQEMHDRTALLAAQAQQAGQVFQWLATDVLPKFRELPDPRVESRAASDERTGATIGNTIAGVPGAAIGDVIGGAASLLGLGSDGQAKANAQAQSYLRALNEHLIVANNALPSPVGAPASGTGGDAAAPGSGLPGSAGGASGGGVLPGSAAGAAGAAGGSAAGAGVPALALVTSAGGAKMTRGVPGTGTPPGSGQASPGAAPPGGAGAAPDPAGRLQGLTPGPQGAAPGPAAGGPAGAPGTGPAGPAPAGGVPVPGGLTAGGGADSSAGENALASDSALGDGSALADGSQLPGSGIADGGPVAGDAVMLGGPAGEDPGAGVAGDLPGTGAPVVTDAPGALGAADPATAAAADGTISSAPLGAAADTAGVSALGGDEMPGSLMTGVPMAGSGPGQRERERHRQAWMNEEESIWGAPRDHVPPVIEGGS